MWDDAGRTRRVAGRSAMLTMSVLFLALVAPPDARAAVSVRSASLSSGTLTIEGRGAMVNATITVTSPESVATGRADSRGRFEFTSSRFTSSTCRASVSDGTSPVGVTLSGCTPSTPPPSPPPSSSSPPTSLTLSHSSLDRVGNLSVAGVTFDPNPVVPLDLSVSSSHPAAAVPATVHVERFADPANPVASFTVTYASEVTVSTAVTISVTGAGVTRSAVLTLLPPPAPTLGGGERGPGFVGSDFATFATSGSTIALGPDGTGPLDARITAGSLPQGLSLVQPGCATPAKCPYVFISGVPTTVQTSTFTVSATDAAGKQATGTFTITVNPPRTLTMTAQTWAPLEVGSFSNLWLEAAGGVRPYRWAHTAGTLPPGMSLVQDNPDGPLVRVTGTPTAGGTYDFTLRLTDAQATTVTRSFSVGVASASAPPPSSSATLTVTASGRSGERVLSSPAGISVPTGSTGSASFAQGTTVTLSVSNGRDAVWSGACSSSGDKTRTCSLVLSSNATVNASIQ